MFMTGLIENLGKLILGGIIKDIGKEIFSKKINNNKGFITILDANIKDSKIENVLKDIAKLKMEIFKMDIPKKDKIELLNKIKLLVSKIKEKINFNHLKNFDLDFKDDSEIESESEDISISEIKKILKEIKSILAESGKKKVLHKMVVGNSNNNLSVLSSIHSNYKDQKNDNGLKKEELHSLIMKKGSFINGKKEIVDSKMNESLISSKKQTINDIRKKIEKEMDEILKNENGKKTFLGNDIKELKLKIYKDHGQNNQKFLQKRLEFESKILKFKDDFKKDDKNEFSNHKFSSDLSSKSNILKISNHISTKNNPEILDSRSTNFTEKVLSQIKNGIIKSNIKNELTIKLEPPDLGKVHIKIVMVNNELTAKITTQHAGVRDVILHNLNSLQEALKEKGINLSNFNVSVSSEFKDAHEKNNNPNFGNKHKKIFSDELFEENDDMMEAWNLIYEIEHNLNLNLKI